MRLFGIISLLVLLSVVTAADTVPDTLAGLTDAQKQELKVAAEKKKQEIAAAADKVVDKAVEDKKKELETKLDAKKDDFLDGIRDFFGDAHSNTKLGLSFVIVAVVGAALV
eukprot:Lankesteria_metandrocarpae@DN4401_c0_g1_i1.p1